MTGVVSALHACSAWREPDRLFNCKRKVNSGNYRSARRSLQRTPALLHGATKGSLHDIAGILFVVEVEVAVDGEFKQCFEAST
ncbi:MAG: hypothetical protein WB611_29655 [Stellaceae bacterium]